MAHEVVRIEAFVKQPGHTIAHTAEEFLCFLRRASQLVAEEGRDPREYTQVLHARAAELERAASPPLENSQTLLEAMAEQLSVDPDDVVQHVPKDSDSEEEVGSSSAMLVGLAEKLRFGIGLVTCLSNDWRTASYEPTGRDSSRMLWLGYDHLGRFVPLVCATGNSTEMVFSLPDISDTSAHNVVARLRREIGVQSVELISRLVRKKMAIPMRDSGSPWSGRLGRSPTVKSGLNFYRLLSVLWLVKKSGSNHLTGRGASFELYSKLVGSLSQEARSKVRSSCVTLYPCVTHFVCSFQRTCGNLVHIQLIRMSGRNGESLQSSNEGSALSCQRFRSFTIFLRFRKCCNYSCDSTHMDVAMLIL